MWGKQTSVFYKVAVVLAATCTNTAVAAYAEEAAQPPSASRHYVFSLEGNNPSPACNGAREMDVANNSLTFHGALGRVCTGTLQRDGTFAMSCGGVGTRPTLNLSGRIQGTQIAGTFEAQGVGFGAAAVHCVVPFSGKSE